MSEDQTPARADEAQRIRDAGGFVIHKRVMGELAVSRAFGDAELKRPVHELVRPNEPAPAEAGPRMVLAEPEVTHRAAEGDFALIACDGLYDVFSSDEAVDVVRKGLVENAGDPVRAAGHSARLILHPPGTCVPLTATVGGLNVKEQHTSRQRGPSLCITPLSRHTWE